MNFLNSIEFHAERWEKFIDFDTLNQVYKGITSTGEQVAIKRARKDSMQGAMEFKNEIELLSRVHHKNVVGLVGFCYEQGEQMLVYEFMAKGNLRNNLLGDDAYTQTHANIAHILTL